MLNAAKSALLAACTKAAQETPPDILEQRRHAFLEKYPPDALSSLTGDALMRFVHGDRAKSGLFYDLEFGQPWNDFGSVAGGSALKFKVYRAGDGTGYKKKGPGNVPVPCTNAEAEQMTGDLMRAVSRALRAADELSLQQGDLEGWRAFDTRVTADSPAWHDKGGSERALLYLGWVHKYIAMARPDLFSFHHRTRQLAAHLIRLGETPITSDSRYLMDWYWRKLRLDDADLRELHPALLMKAAYNTFGAETAYWRVGTDERTDTDNVDRWPAMKAGGFASVGWGRLGDLKLLLAGFEGTAAIARLKEVLTASEQEKPVQETTTPSVIGKWASQIHQFYTGMRPGDRVIAMKGRRWLSVGEITGEYEYHASDLQPHHRTVQWHDIAEESWPDHPGLRSTVFPFADRYAEAARVEQKLLTSDVLPVTSLPDTPQKPALDLADVQEVRTPLAEPVPLTAFEQRVRDILGRKGQVILYGPPGTGKTYNGRHTARELIARERCGGRTWAALTEEEQRTVDEAITFVTFHPAYAYEDFIEGYRPIPPGDDKTGTGPNFEARNGVFVEVCERARKEPSLHQVLLIDEINRGNVAAVLGELITLLEADKRGSVSAVLPISRRAFTVPTNLWIVGTMNTADRSISLLDAALRRRFGFVELLPETERIAVTVDGLSLSALLAEINARVRKYVTRNARELQVGHAYLMHAGHPLATRSEVHAAFRDDILPLLAEYCFENYTSLAKIVGDEIIDVAAQVPRSSVMNDPGRLHKALLQLVGSDPARDTELGNDEEDEPILSANEEQEDSESLDNVGAFE